MPPITIPSSTALLKTTQTQFSSFTQRLLQVSITLNQNPPQTNQPTTFADGSTTLTISGLRMSVHIKSAGGIVGSEADVTIYGMADSEMQQLSTLGLVFQSVQQNTITIKAGDAINGFSTVFIGTIMSAFGDYNASPNVGFQIKAKMGQLSAVVAIPPSSYPQATDVATIMQNLATQMQMGFENNGVEVTLPPGYYPGSGQDQWQKVAIDAGIIANLVPGSTGTTILAIWPKGKTRGGVVPLIAPPPDGTMIGYPSYTQYGINVKTVFNPQLSFGGRVQVQSSLQGAVGMWAVLRLDHALDTLIEKGMWESTLWCFNPIYPTPSVPVA